MTTGQETTGPTSAMRTLTLAAMVACSWTWCIGMFLPVLLIRDFGLWSYAVFLIPNALGAAAMGLTVAGGEHSRRLVAAHAPMMLFFSSVTRSFQMFFLVWILTGVLYPDGVAVLGIALAAGIGLGFGALRSAAPASAIICWCLTVVAAAVAWAMGGLRPPPDLTARLGTGELAWLAPVVVFGFVLCPYLDLTFHRARQAADADGRDVGRRAFGLGFLVLFVFNVALTPLYAWLFLGGERLMGSPELRTAAALPVLAHIAMQLGYTIQAHGVKTDGAGAVSAAAGRVSGTVGLLAGLLVILLPPGPQPALGGLELGEVIYRMFMAFYGLVFPAYVWLAVVPTWRHPGAPTARMWKVMAVAVAVAGPMYYMGFIEGRTWWLAPGLGVVLVARLLVGQRGGEGAGVGGAGGEELGGRSST